MAFYRKAVVIGAGIGGIATAIYLARNGYSVKVFEKNSGAGGRCGQINHEGHRFDLGATMLLMPGVYRDVFRDLDLDLDEALEVKELDQLYRLCFDDGSHISFTTDMSEMETQHEQLEKGSYLMAQKYIEDGYEFYRIARKKLIGRNFYNFFEFATLKNAAMLIRLKTYLTHQKYAGRFFRHPHLQMAYTFQNIYVGQSPFDAPAFFAMIPAIELKEGSFFPRGGIYNVVKTLLDKAASLGVEFHYESEVQSVLVSRNRADGIRLATGKRIEADLVVANADLPYVYRELLPDRRRAARFDRMNYSCSAMVFHWGVDKVFPQLAHHNVFLSDTFRTGLKIIFKEKAADPSPSFYVHAPARIDPSAAPPEHDTLSVIVGIGHVDRKKEQDWNYFRKISRDAVLERLRKEGLTDIEKHIKFEICYTPRTWENAFNVVNGSVFGSLSHSIFQMGWFRPHNRHGKYRNLYFVGGSTHPGNGIPLVLLSAKLTTERILKEQKV